MFGTVLWYTLLVSRKVAEKKKATSQVISQLSVNESSCAEVERKKHTYPNYSDETLRS